MAIEKSLKSAGFQNDQTLFQSIYQGLQNNIIYQNKKLNLHLRKNIGVFLRIGVHLRWLMFGVSCKIQKYTFMFFIL